MPTTAWSRTDECYRVNNAIHVSGQDPWRQPTWCSVRSLPVAIVVALTLAYRLPQLVAVRPQLFQESEHPRLSPPSLVVGVGVHDVV